MVTLGEINEQLDQAFGDNPTNINLSKKIYGLRGALEVLDE